MTNQLENQTVVNPANVHYFSLNGDNIVLDVPSGSIFKCDAEMIAALEALTAAAGNFAQAAAANPAAAEALDELQQLARDGVLFTPDLAGYTPPQAKIKSLCLNISHDCDLRCAYCFASTGHFGGERKNMPLEVAQKALDFLLENSGNRRQLEVDFFGGEPMMNIEVVMAAVAYGKEQQKKYGKEIAFTFTTNGVQLNDQVTEWANREGISMVLSHDGRETVHNATRYFEDGRGSYDIVTKNISRQIATGCTKYYVRGTFTADNLDFVTDIKHWLDLGWKQLSMEPAVIKGGKRALTEQHLPQLRSEYEKLAALYVERQSSGEPFEFFHFNMDLLHAPCLPKRLTGCGAGYEYYVVIPNGDIYPCHQFVGRKDYLMGNLQEGIVAQDRVEEFRACNVFSKEKCRTCWARYYCSGGCHANNELFAHDIYTPYEMGCELSKMRTECSLWVALKQF